MDIFLKNFKFKKNTLNNKLTIVLITNFTTTKVSKKLFS